MFQYLELLRYMMYSRVYFVHLPLSLVEQKPYRAYVPMISVYWMNSVKGYWAAQE